MAGGERRASGRAREVLEELEEGTPAEREAVLALAPFVLHVWRAGPRRADALEGAIGETTREEMPKDPEEMSDELSFELEVENLVRLSDRYRWIEERSLSGPGLRERLGGDSRQRLEQLRKRGRLFGLMLPFRGSYVYPHGSSTRKRGGALKTCPGYWVPRRRRRGPADADGFIVGVGRRGQGSPLPDVPIRPRAARSGAGGVGAALSEGS